MLTGRAAEIENGILLREGQARVLAERQKVLETAGLVPGKADSCLQMGVRD